jgi:hypothetical protein
VRSTLVWFFVHSEDFKTCGGLTISASTKIAVMIVGRAVVVNKPKVEMID